MSSLQREEKSDSGEETIEDVPDPAFYSSLSPREDSGDDMPYGSVGPIDVNLFPIFDELKLDESVQEVVERKDIAMEFADLENLRYLGHGNFGVTFKAEYEGRNVVIKVPRQEPSKDEKQELATLKNLATSPNVLRLFGTCKKFAFKDVNGCAGIAVIVKDKELADKCFDSIVLPCLENGDLKKYLEAIGTESLEERQLINIYVGMLRGIVHLHKNKVVHRDIALRNFLVSETGRIVTADFGLSRGLESSISSKFSEAEPYYKNPHAALPWQWCAPETLVEYRSFHASDVWMIGVTLVEIFEKPFTNTTIMKHAITISNPNFKLPTPKTMIKFLRDTAIRCCTLDPKKRPKSSELLHEVLVEYGAREKVQYIFDHDKEESVHSNLECYSGYEISKRFGKAERWDHGKDTEIEIDVGNYMERDDFSDRKKIQRSSELFFFESATFRGKRYLIRGIDWNNINVDDLRKELPPSPSVLWRVGRTSANWNRRANSDVFPFIKGTPLVTYLSSFSAERLATLDLLYICRGILRSIFYLHKNKVYHRMIRLENFSVSREGKIYTTDYASFYDKSADLGTGYGRLRADARKYFPWRWYAPESVTSNSFTEASDLWMFGMTLIEIYEQPFEVVRNQIELGVKMSQPDFKVDPPEQMDPYLKSLVLRCCQVDPEKRPSAKELLEELNTAKKNNWLLPPGHPDLNSESKSDLENVDEFSDVKNLLTEWKLDFLIDHFMEEEMDLASLKDYNGNDLIADLTECDITLKMKQKQNIRKMIKSIN